MDDQITIHAAKARLSSLLRRVEAGEEIVITRRGQPVARLVPVPRAPNGKRQPGRLKGQVALDDAFWEPLSDEELKRWGMT